MNETTQTINQALGGLKQVRMMIGASAILETESGVSIRFKARAKDSINLLSINYDGGQDLFDIDFQRSSVRGVKTVDTFKGIFTEDMKQIIEQRTGLYLSL